MTAPSRPDADQGDDWHRRTGDAVIAELDVDPATGLSSPDAASRLRAAGPNRLPEPAVVPAWRRFLSQFHDLLIIILLVAAVVSFLVSGELKTPLVVLAVVVVNATLGFVQQNRAEAALTALRRMMVTRARVRRDGAIGVAAVEDLVAGDVVLLEAGDRVPADGRLLEAVQLEVSEAALTGESTPSEKHTEAIDAEVTVGDRRNMVYLNTAVTRGRGVLVVTATGEDTEIGRLAGLLRAAPPQRTPLQHQLDQLARSLAKLSGVVVAIVVLLGLARGVGLGDLLLTAVALAVATIPEGLPAVTAVTLSIGVARMAQRNAIVKQLASVETLGCTSVICTDKTGTLTLNQMSVTDIVTLDGDLSIPPSGYDPDPAGFPEAAADDPVVSRLLLAVALCNDAAIRPADEGGWDAVGDPTEAGLVVLAARGGLDPSALRYRYPRTLEVPFDSRHKLMATAHHLPGEDGIDALRLVVKGAPDVLFARSVDVAGREGAAAAGERRDWFERCNRELAGRGLRVLAVAERLLDHDELSTPPEQLVAQLTFLGLVGIVDPPRAEARAAISEARGAGIDLKMITGDHAATAGAIADQLGLGGRDGSGTLTGAELDRLSDDELRDRLPVTSVFARVAPEHKLRLVEVLQSQGHVVAMTGDGVNDAPALKRADIGIAMGITGTEVTKEAAVMVLADDNVATIVGAVRRGRAIYDNIVAFVRFQLSTSLGFAAVFLGAALLGIADGKPFSAIAILWVNIIMDGPPAMALGVDPADDDVMLRRPRPRDEPVLTRARWSAIAISAVVMAAGTLAVLEWAPGADPTADQASVAATMAFTTFVLFQFWNILNARDSHGSVFRRSTFTNPALWIALACVAGLQAAVVHLAPLQRLFDTTSITGSQWLICVAVASSVLWVEELRKLLARRRAPNHEISTVPPRPAASVPSS